MVTFSFGYLFINLFNIIVIWFKYLTSYSVYYYFQHVYELLCDSKCLTDSEMQMCIKRQQRGPWKQPLTLVALIYY